MSELTPEDHAELDRLNEQKWDLLEALAAVEMLKAAILNRNKGVIG